MLKFLQDQSEVLDMLTELHANSLFSDFRIGVAGSYAVGNNKAAKPPNKQEGIIKLYKILFILSL